MGRTSTLVCLLLGIVLVAACGKVEVADVDASAAVDAPPATDAPATIGAPTNVVATAAAGAVVNLTWSAPSASGATITGYTVTSDPAGAMTTTSTESASVSSGLTVGTMYTFTVTPQSTAGPGQGATSNAVTAGDRPGAPTNVTAAVISPGTVRVNWTAPADNAYPITGYTVTTTPASVSATTTLLTATLGPIPAGSYTFDVVATNALGNSAPGTSASLSVCTTQTRTFTGVDKVDVNYGTVANTYTDNMARAYSGGTATPGYDITGWYKFNTTGIPSGAQVTAMRLSAYAVSDFGSPHMSPNVAISYSTNRTWTRMTATPANLPRTQQLTGGLGVPTASIYNNYTIPPGARDWSADFAAGAITIGVTNVNPDYSYAYFRGTDTTEKPTLLITTCE